MEDIKITVKLRSQILQFDIKFLEALKNIIKFFARMLYRIQADTDFEISNIMRI